MEPSNGEALISRNETEKEAQSDELNKCSPNIFTLRSLLMVSAILKILPIFPPSE